METKKYQIALVDDEPQITKLLKLTLKDNFNCEVETFNDPTDALARLKEKAFDAISLDHRMPKLTGMDIVELLRLAEGPNKKTRILLLTGFREEAECHNEELLNEVIFLDKPITNEKFVRWMKVILNDK